MIFEEAYGYYTQGGQTSYQPEGSTGHGHDQGFYYPSGMGTSHGLTARMGAIELRQEELAQPRSQHQSHTGELGDVILLVL